MGNGSRRRLRRSKSRCSRRAIPSRTNRGLSSTQMATTISQIQAVNPATGEVIASFDAFGADEVEMALAEAHDAFLEWRERPARNGAVRLAALAPSPQGVPARTAPLARSGWGRR